jgi:hypothetical protein
MEGEKKFWEQINSLPDMIENSGCDEPLKSLMMSVLCQISIALAQMDDCMHDINL